MRKWKKKKGKENKNQKKRKNSRRRRRTDQARGNKTREFRSIAPPSPPLSHRRLPSVTVDHHTHTKGERERRMLYLLPKIGWNSPLTSPRFRVFIPEISLQKSLENSNWKWNYILNPPTNPQWSDISLIHLKNFEFWKANLNPEQTLIFGPLIRNYNLYAFLNMTLKIKS